MSKRILTPRALNAHATKSAQKRKQHWHAQPKIASEVAAILSSPNTPPDVREFLKSAMREWAEATDAVNTPELARDAFIAMNCNTKSTADLKKEGRGPTASEYRAYWARMAVVDTAIMVSYAESSGEPIAVNKKMRECYAKLEGRGTAEEEVEDVPAVEAPHIAPVIDLLCWRQTRPRPVRNCTVRVEG